MHQVLSRGATNIIAAHHGEHAQVKMVGLVETDHSLHEVPHEAREIVEEGSGPVSDAWNVEEAIDLEVGEVWDLEEVQDSSKHTVLIIDIHNWSQSNEGFEVLGKVGIKRICNEPLSCSLRVAEPDNLREVALSVCQNVFDVSGNIILGHISHGEIPVLLIVGGVVEMLVGISCASVVGCPNIIPEVNKLQRNV